MRMSWANIPGIGFKPYFATATPCSITDMTGRCAGSVKLVAIRLRDGDAPPHPTRVSCMAEVPRVGPQAPGLVSARYRRGPRRLRGLRQPLAGRRPRGRPRGTPSAPHIGALAAALPGAETIDPGIPLARAGVLWLPRPSLDLCPRGSCHRSGVRRPLPQGPCRSDPQEPGLDPAAADQAGHPAGRGSRPAVARRDLAGAETAGQAGASGAR